MLASHPAPRDIWAAANSAEDVEDLSEFLEVAETIVCHFLEADGWQDIFDSLSERYDIKSDESDEDKLTLIHALWDVVSRGHRDRHAVERLIEVAIASSWYGNHQDQQVLSRVFEAIL